MPAGFVALPEENEAFSHSPIRMDMAGSAQMQSATVHYYCAVKGLSLQSTIPDAAYYPAANIELSEHDKDATAASGNADAKAGCLIQRNVSAIDSSAPLGRRGRGEQRRHRKPIFPSTALESNVR